MGIAKHIWTSRKCQLSNVANPPSAELLTCLRDTVKGGDGTHPLHAEQRSLLRNIPCRGTHSVDCHCSVFSTEARTASSRGHFLLLPGGRNRINNGQIKSWTLLIIGSSEADYWKRISFVNLQHCHPRSQRVKPIPPIPQGAASKMPVTKFAIPEQYQYQNGFGSYHEYVYNSLLTLFL